MKRERSESRVTISGWRVNYVKTRGIRIAIIRRRTMNFQKKNVQMKTKNIDIHDSSLDKLSSSARKRNINRIERKANVNIIFSYLDGLLRGVPRRALCLSLCLQAHRCIISATLSTLKIKEKY